MSLRAITIGALIAGCVFSTQASVGESAVITLVFPFGARATGMGEVGTALADDESALYFNPAGLGVRNPGWRRGSFANSFERLLPAFHLTELWHASFAGYYQTPGDFGGISAYINYINMGRNPITDELGREKVWVRSWEMVISTGWGFSFRELGDSTRYAGFALKYIVSALAPGLGENGAGVGRTFAVDLGYLRVLRNGLRLGLNFANMGPHIYYVSQEQRDPIPFTLNAAVGWKRRVVLDGIERFRFATELRLDRELVVNHYNGEPEPFYKAMFTDWTYGPAHYQLQQINYHLGFEWWFFNTGCWRQGFLFDYLGERYELTTGFGLSLFNHFKWDFSFIFAPEGFMKGLLRQFDPYKDGATGARQGQWRMTFTVDGFGGGNAEDQKWWMVNKERETW